VSFGIQFTTARSEFGISIGGQSIANFNGLDITDYNPHTVTVSVDASGNATTKVDGVTMVDQDQTGINTASAQSISMEQWWNLGSSTKISNFSITSTSTSSPTNVSAVATASNLGGLSLSTITSAIQDVATMRANNGAEQSRLGFAATMLTTNQTNLQSAISDLTDVDVAAETTHLAKWNVLVQAGTSMLTQANQSAQMALKLITGS
jgi:flagellin